MFFDEEKFKALIREAVREELSSQRTYQDYASVAEFAPLIGISKSDLENKILNKDWFIHCQYRFDNSKKWYIHIENGKKAVAKHLKPVRK